MDEVEKCEKHVRDQIRAEKIIKGLNNSSFLIPQLAYRSKNRKSITKFQLKKWLPDDVIELDNIIAGLIAARSITEISDNVYAVTKDFWHFWPSLNRGESPTEIIQNSEF